MFNNGFKILEWELWLNCLGTRCPIAWVLRGVSTQCYKMQVLLLFLDIRWKPKNLLCKGADLVLKLRINAMFMKDKKYAWIGHRPKPRYMRYPKQCHLCHSAAALMQWNTTHSRLTEGTGATKYFGKYCCSGGKPWTSETLKSVKTYSCSKEPQCAEPYRALMKRQGWSRMRDLQPYWETALS